MIDDGVDESERLNTVEEMALANKSWSGMIVNQRYYNPVKEQEGWTWLVDALHLAT